HLIYPQVVEWICTGTIQHSEKAVLYRGQVMYEPVQFCKV
ncbi:MAG: phosphoribosylglycinamide formyltransferase, partial [Acinetobacter sp.]